MITYGRVSLWEMINFSVKRLCSVLRDLEAEERWAQDAKLKGYSFGSSREERERIVKLVGSALYIGVDVGMEAVIHRAAVLNNKLVKSMDWDVYETEVRVLRETLEGHLQGIHVYRYPIDKFQYYLKCKATWHKTLDAFPHIENEVLAGADCYALGYNTACVFHMVRVAEFGLRAMAAKLKIRTVRKVTPIEWGAWNEVISAISRTLEAVHKTTASRKKDAEKAFYNAAISDMRAIQDLYRDKTAHLRESYDDGQAQSAMIRVRGFMDSLADNIGKRSR